MRKPIMLIDKPIREEKARLASYAIQKHGAKSFADLGACWGVNAGYAIDVLKRNQIERAYAVDQRITDLSRERGASFSQLSFVSGGLGVESKEVVHPS